MLKTGYNTNVCKNDFLLCNHSFTTLSSLTYSIEILVQKIEQYLDIKT